VQTLRGISFDVKFSVSLIKKKKASTLLGQCVQYDLGNVCAQRCARLLACGDELNGLPRAVEHALQLHGEAF
jgi:hypothetical protein